MTREIQPSKDSERATAREEGAEISWLQLALAAVFFIAAIIWAMAAGAFFQLGRDSFYFFLKNHKPQRGPQTGRADNQKTP